MKWGGYARCFLLTALPPVAPPTRRLPWRQDPGGPREREPLGEHGHPAEGAACPGTPRLTAIRSASSRYVEGSASHDAAELTEDEVDLAFYDKLARWTLEIRRKGPVMRFLYPQAEAASLQALGHGICAKVAAATLEDAAATLEDAAAFVSGLRDAGYDLGD